MRYPRRGRIQTVLPIGRYFPLKCPTIFYGRQLRRVAGRQTGTAFSPETYIRAVLDGVHVCIEPNGVQAAAKKNPVSPAAG